MLGAVCVFACPRLEKGVVLLLSCDLAFQEKIGDSYINRFLEEILGDSHLTIAPTSGH